MALKAHRINLTTLEDWRSVHLATTGGPWFFRERFERALEQVPAAEPGAALLARRSVLDFWKTLRRALDQGERIQRELFKLRVAESGALRRRPA